MSSSSSIAIIGAGSVGATIAYAAMLRGVTPSITLVDTNEEKLRGEVADLNHGLQFVPAVRIEAGAIADCAAADVIVITAGAKQRAGESRLDLAERNVALFADLVPRLASVAPQAILLVVSNPVDVLTYVALQGSGLPESRVIGSGTVLDTSRLRYLLAARLRLSAAHVHAYMIGEHGDSELPLWSTAQVGQVPLQAFDVPGRRKLTVRDRSRIVEDVRAAAQRVIKAKGATNWAIGLATVRILEAVLRDEHAVLPVSRLLTDYHGISDVCLSVPSVVSSDGVGPALPLPLNDAELAGLRQSAEVVRDVIDRIRPPRDG